MRMTLRKAIMAPWVAAAAAAATARAVTVAAAGFRCKALSRTDFPWAAHPSLSISADRGQPAARGRWNRPAAATAETTCFFVHRTAATTTTTTTTTVRTRRRSPAHGHPRPRPPCVASSPLQPRFFPHSDPSRTGFLTAFLLPNGVAPLIHNPPTTAYARAWARVSCVGILSVSALSQTSFRY